MTQNKINFEDIKSKIKISDFARKLGILVNKDQRACCHIHHEKTPSLHFNDEKRFYYCFGCHKSGDVFSLVQEIKGFSFLEAVRYVAETVGVNLEDDYGTLRNSSDFDRKKKLLYRMMEDICEFFESQLSKNSLDYLANRGLSLEIIKKFRLGFSGSDTNELVEKLETKYSNDINLLLDSGLFRRGSFGNRFYNILQNRIIFPIFDKFGKVIAFGGRIFGDSDGPKYLNCADSLLFKKSETLYGENFIRQKARAENEIIIVEGYLDCIQMHQIGYENTVAPLGTAITDLQIDHLWSIVDKIICTFDGDVAGKKAAAAVAIKSLPIIKSGKFLSFTKLPEGSDPCDMIQDGKKGELDELLKNSSPLSRKLLELALQKYGDGKSPDTIAGIKKELISYLKVMEDKGLRSAYARYFRDEIENLSVKRNSEKDSVSRDYSAFGGDNSIRNNIMENNSIERKSRWKDKDNNYNYSSSSSRYGGSRYGGKSGYDNTINIYDEIFCYLIVLIFIFPEHQKDFIKDDLLHKIYSKSSNRHKLKVMLEYSIDNCLRKKISDLGKRFPEFSLILETKFLEISTISSSGEAMDFWLKYFFYKLQLIELKKYKEALKNNPMKLIEIEEEERRINNFIFGDRYD